MLSYPRAMRTSLSPAPVTSTSRAVGTIDGLFNSPISVCVTRQALPLQATCLLKMVWVLTLNKQLAPAAAQFTRNHGSGYRAETQTHGWVCFTISPEHPETQRRQEAKKSLIHLQKNPTHWITASVLGLHPNSRDTLMDKSSSSLAQDAVGSSSCSFRKGSD